MSATANFYLIETSKLDDLKQNAEVIVKKSLFSKKTTDNYWDYLSANATQLKGNNGSGYVYASLFMYLQDQKGIDLTENEYDGITKELANKRGVSHFIFTHQQKQQIDGQLAPQNHSMTDIQQFNSEFTGEDYEETAQETLDAMGVLHDNLNQIQNNSQVLLLIVG